MRTLFKKSVAFLLLISLVNIVTARPGGYCDVLQAKHATAEPRFNKTESLTVIEFFLENIRGLPDNIPNADESGFRYNVFCRSGKVAVASQQLIGCVYNTPAAALPAAVLTPVHNSQSPRFHVTACYGYLFRLTPF